MRGQVIPGLLALALFEPPAVLPAPGPERIGATAVPAMPVCGLLPVRRPSRR